MELTKAVLDCMQAIRRRLREEQALDIRLNQADAITAMLAACGQSENPDTQALGERLAELSGTQVAAPALTEEQLIEKYTQYAGPLRG
ncbi:hypothetical protein [Pseudomonas sp. RIT-PI-AD]|uniref:hypothetical protein n=1 Tax=Pseudomonas sp. RIT-PI-AD TaxID=3035294 RepID=UPI0021DB6842|nr:hypothetical protein [Pseudomonas sp. RIT-PI-AD]